MRSILKIEDVIVVAAMPEELQGLLEMHGVEVVYTGLGKVNATYKLMRALMERSVQNKMVKGIINFGTAGSSKIRTHALVEVTEFVQRDMDVSPLGIARGVTPFDLLPTVLKVPCRFSKLSSGSLAEASTGSATDPLTDLSTGLEAPLAFEVATGSCGTGDSFEITHPDTQFRALDEEDQVSFFENDELPPVATASSLLLPYYDLVDMECYALAKVCEQEGIAFCSIKYISDGADASASNDWQANLPKAAAAFAAVFPMVLQKM